MIILIILVGGLTRLTDSGLSITTWELFSGTLPPLTNEAYAEVKFNKVVSAAPRETERSSAIY